VDILQMIDKALANPDVAGYAVPILKSIKSQVSNGIPPTVKQYSVIYNNFRSKSERKDLQRELSARPRRRRYR